MRSVHVKASKEYDVLIGQNLLDKAASYMDVFHDAKTAVIITDDIVGALYADRLKEALKDTGLSVGTFVFPHGEQSKNLSVYGQTLEYMNSLHMTRSDLVLALGGGVVGDLAGFAAATYQRGIRFVQIPTTLLAAVDSSVGGKTAVDLKNSKNQVGCFWQPSLVLCDTVTLDTLPEEQFLCGLAEVIKYGVIGNEPFFEQLLKADVREHIEEVIETCVSMKRDIVQNDEFDTGQRMLLNFGHTFGHAAEALSGFSVLHGQAVAMGMAVMARAACARGRCSAGTVLQIEQILGRYGLPDKIPYDRNRMIREIAADKKKAGDRIRLVIPERIGKCVIETVPADMVGELLKDGGVA